jgi:hypothetical protein
VCSKEGLLGSLWNTYMILDQSKETDIQKDVGLEFHGTCDKYYRNSKCKKFCEQACDRLVSRTSVAPAPRGRRFDPRWDEFWCVFLGLFLGGNGYTTRSVVLLVFHEGSSLSNLFSSVCMDAHACVHVWSEYGVRGCVRPMYVPSQKNARKFQCRI